MLAIHDQHEPFTCHIRSRLKITGMGLGLVRLLLDAKRTKEARATLFSLQSGFQGADEAVNAAVAARHRLPSVEVPSSGATLGKIIPDRKHDRSRARYWYSCLQ
jgi:hypothetical protein